MNAGTFTPVSYDELHRLITNLNISKSAGPDNIGPKLVKTVSACICTPLLHIFNLSIRNGIVPDELKIAKVVPVYKKGDKKLACNYRPISLLSIFDKLLEKVMKNRLYSYLHINKVLFNYQFGFRLTTQQL